MKVDEFTRKLFEVYKESWKLGPKVHLASTVHRVLLLLYTHLMFCSIVSS